MISLSHTTKNIEANITVTGSKSISNRALIIKAVLNANTLLHNLSDSADTQNLLQALSQIKAHGQAHINVNHAGTNMRFLTAYLAALPGEWTIGGSARMCERPIKPLVDALCQLGAHIEYLGKEGYPPLKIIGRVLDKKTCHVDASVSSQFVSALLLASPLFKNGLNVQLEGAQVSKPYSHMSIAVLKLFGADVLLKNNRLSINFSTNAHTPSLPPNLNIESDWSSASYWYSISALSESANIHLHSFLPDSWQADAKMADIMSTLGVQTTYRDQSIHLKRIPLQTHVLQYNCVDCPDIAQTLAVLCVGLGIEGHLQGLSTLRIKETDRLLALKTELEKFGAKVEIDNASIHIYPAPPHTWAKHTFHIHTYHDHRMALSFAPLALLCQSIKITDDAVIQKSYAKFWADLKSAGFSVNLTT